MILFDNILKPNIKRITKGIPTARNVNRINNHDGITELKKNADEGGDVDIAMLARDIAGIRRALDEMNKPHDRWIFQVERNKRTGLIDEIHASR